MALAVLLSAGWPVTDARAQGVAPFDREAVIDYLMANPDVILEAIERIETQSRIRANRDVIFNHPLDAVGGNPDGDVTIVEFVDYNCPYCQLMLPVLQELLAKDDGIRLVYKEFPILAPTSWYAARVAMIANREGAYEAFHHTMLGVTARSERIVDQVSGMAGIDREDLVQGLANSAVIDQHINDSLALGQELGIDGTPAFIIGDRLLVGEQSLATLQAAVAAARGGS